MKTLRLVCLVSCGLGPIVACSSSTANPPPELVDAEAREAAPGEASISPEADDIARADAQPAEVSDSGSTEALPDALGSEAASADGQALSGNTVLDLDDVKANPSAYTWFDFRPNIKKLILAGAAETEHVAILWYTVAEGGVALHYHAKTESVFVIDGTQTDGKGVYPTGTVYFNPPGSGHEITKSSGFFVLAYAAPPDFASTSSIGEYTPVRLDTTAADLTTTNAFEAKSTGVRTFSPALDATGGLSAQFIETTSREPYRYHGNYVLVLKGSCEIEGVTYGKNMLVVGQSVVPRAYGVAAGQDTSCLAMGVSF